MTLVPLNLFVTHDGRSSRQHVTCRYKCGDACSKPVCNTSDNEYFGDIARQAISRRSALHAAGITVLAAGAGSALAACSLDEEPAAAPTSTEPPPPPAGMNFKPVAPNIEDVVVIPEGYEQGVVISWGDPIVPGAPKFDVRARPLPRNAASSASTMTSLRCCRSRARPTASCW